MKDIVFNSIKIPCVCKRGLIRSINETYLNGKVTHECFIREIKKDTFTFIKVLKETDVNNKISFFTVALKINSINIVDLEFYFLKNTTLTFNLKDHLNNITNIFYKVNPLTQELNIFNFIPYKITRNYEVVSKNLVLFYTKFQKL